MNMNLNTNRIAVLVGLVLFASLGQPVPVGHKTVCGCSPREMPFWFTAPVVASQPSTAWVDRAM